MFVVEIPSTELYDEKKQEFIITKRQSFQIEHSLVSVSKWESKWKKPFLSKDKKTYEETIDYIRCMTITQNIDSEVYNYIPRNIHRRIEEYIGDKMTATWFSENQPTTKSREVITSEIIYYWMIKLNIPFECQKWHLSRLLTLIRVCNIKESKPKKSNKKETIANMSALNKARRAQYNTKG